MSERDAYVAKMKAKLDEWNAAIDQFEARARVAQADVRLMYERQLGELKTNRDAAAQRLRELQLASADAWESLRQGAEAAWKDMADAFRKASDRFR